MVVFLDKKMANEPLTILLFRTATTQYIVALSQNIVYIYKNLLGFLFCKRAFSDMGLQSIYSSSKS